MKSESQEAHIRLQAERIRAERKPNEVLTEMNGDIVVITEGHTDVMEIDAASHGGVDDARSRYKIYIIDEAHMVTSAGFNALLKVVEEPPEHLKFIFVTTEPEKVIETIRSHVPLTPAFNGLGAAVPSGAHRAALPASLPRRSVPRERGPGGRRRPMQLP